MRAGWQREWKVSLGFRGQQACSRAKKNPTGKGTQKDTGVMAESSRRVLAKGGRNRKFPEGTGKVSLRYGKTTHRPNALERTRKAKNCP